MINNPKKSNPELQNTLNNLLGQKSEIGDSLKNLINSLSEDDIKKISGLIKNQEVQNIASSIIESKKKKE